jgi:hypothetical protein
MHETVRFLEQHGYWLLVGAVVGRQACLPIPANLFLVAAGGLARTGTLSIAGILGASVMTFLLADLAWYSIFSLKNEPGGAIRRRVSFLFLCCELSVGSGADQREAVLSRKAVLH